MRTDPYCQQLDLWRSWELLDEMSRIYSPALIFSAMSAASPESLVLTMVCPFITVTWSPLTVATIGSELSFAPGVLFEGCPSGRGILPISAVAPAATAATPTPNFRNSLRETFLFWLFSDSFSTLSSDVNRFLAVRSEEHTSELQSR